jgi:hypothetical protein
MGIHAAGGNQTTLRIDDLAACRGFDLFAHSDDLSVIAYQDAAAGNILPHHGLDIAVFDQ